MHHVLCPILCVMMQGGAVPIPGLVELPSCPVCLERMDESVDGILTILCNHSFHSHCLKKWGDTRSVPTMHSHSVRMHSHTNRSRVLLCEYYVVCWFVFLILCFLIRVSCGLTNSSELVKGLDKGSWYFTSWFELTQCWDVGWWIAILSKWSDRDSGRSRSIERSPPLPTKPLSQPRRCEA